MTDSLSFIISGLYLCRKGFFNAPASSYSVDQGVRLHPNMVSPKRSGHCFTIKRKNLIGGRVVSLLFWCGPPAIIFAIPKRTVNSVDRHSIRSLPHITKKRNETGPFPANGNAFQRIKMRFLRCDCFAPLKYSRPYPIRSATRHPVSSNFIRAKPVITRQASTALRSAGSDRRSNGNKLSSAVAQTAPSCMTSRAIGSFFAQDDKFSKPLPFHVFNSHIVGPCNLYMYSVLYVARSTLANGWHGQKAMWNVMKKTEELCLHETLMKLYGGRA